MEQNNLKNEYLEASADASNGIIEIKILKECEEAYSQSLDFINNLLQLDFSSANRGFEIKYIGESKESIPGLPETSTNLFFAEALRYENLYGKIEDYVYVAAVGDEWYRDMDGELSAMPGIFAAFGLAIKSRQYLPLLKHYFSKIDGEHQSLHVELPEMIIGEYGIDEETVALAVQGLLSYEQYYNTEIPKITDSDEGLTLLAKVLRNEDSAHRLLEILFEKPGELEKRAETYDKQAVYRLLQIWKEADEESWEDYWENLNIDLDDFDFFDEDEDEEEVTEISAKTSFDGDWDALINIFLNTEGIRAKDIEWIKRFDEQRKKYAFNYMQCLYDNEVLVAIATNHQGNKIPHNEPYVKLSLNTAKYIRSAVINGNDGSGNIDACNYLFDLLPNEFFNKISEFLSSYGFGEKKAEELPEQEHRSWTYNEIPKLDLENIKLPQDSDFSDNSADNISDSTEIYHNTVLINKILTLLLEWSEGWNKEDQLVLKQFIALISSYPDMYLCFSFKGMPHELITISCARKGQYQMIAFSMNAGYMDTTVNYKKLSSTSSGVLSDKRKKMISDIIREYKPDWVN